MVGRAPLTRSRTADLVRAGSTLSVVSVPLLSENFEGKRVALYNQSIRAENPLTAVLFKNDTGMVLEGGPVTVYDPGTYLGEGIMSLLKEGEETLIPFAVELGCRIRKDSASENRTYFRLQIESGVMKFTRARLITSIYVLNNENGKADLDLFLDHPIGVGRELVEPEKPYETTSNYYRFRIQLAAGETSRFNVVQRTRLDETIRVLDLKDDRLQMYLETNLVDQKTETRIRELLGIQRELDTIKESLENLKTEGETIFQNQKRVRENLAALGTHQEDLELRRRYLRQLNEEEDRLREIENERRVQQERRNELQESRNRKVRELSFENEISGNR